MADGARDLPGPRARAVGGLPRALPDAMETAAPGGDHPRVRVELMPIGGPNQTFTLGQNRLAAGVGLPLSSRVRTEIGYMNLYNAFRDAPGERDQPHVVAVVALHGGGAVVR